MDYRRILSSVFLFVLSIFVCPETVQTFDQGYVHSIYASEIENLASACNAVGYIGDIALTDEDYRYYSQESENLQEERQSSQLKGDTGVVTEAPTHEDEEELHSRVRRAVTSRRERKWPNGVIPYLIDANFTGSQRAIFKQAMRHWENYTCLTFLERNPVVHPNYIVFTYEPCGCCSFVGMKGDGPQSVSIGKNCDKFGVVVHELGHAIGFWHEHTRPDRDEHVSIIRQNIQGGQEYNFEKLDRSEVNSLNESYDYSSIMHYARNTFSRGLWLDTVVPLQHTEEGAVPDIGQRKHLSPGDVVQANKLYSCPACGRTFIESNGNFTYPMQRDAVNTADECIWRISVTPGETIRLTISSLDMVGSKNCWYDYIVVRDGHWEFSPVLGQFCGGNAPAPIVSTRNRLWVKMKKSTHPFSLGFSAKYEAICGGNITRRERGVIQSPNYPDYYSSNKECIWIITIRNRNRRGYQVGLRFNSFDVERHDNCIYDYVEVRDGSDIDSPLLGRFCGYTMLPDDLKSTGNTISVKFVSDSSVNKAGFSAEFFQEIDECADNDGGCEHACINTVGSYRCECNPGFTLMRDGLGCEKACGGLKTSLQGNISTPQYPNMYPRDKNCIWKISAPSSYHISLQFRDFQLEGTELCKYDFVEIRGGFSPDADRIGNRLCGSDIPETVTSPSNTLYIQFKSDSTVSKKGFFATFFADMDECENDNGECQHTCINTLGSYMCSCRNGFTLHENGHDCKESKCQKEITDVSGVITSPNFPDNYPKRKQCSWHIIATPGHRVELDFDEFDLEAHQECAYDHVRLYDGDSDERLGLGTFCGHHLPDDILSSGNHMFISFYSDASVSRPGFSARHRTVCGGTLMATHDQLSLYSHAELSDGNYPSQADCLWRIIAPQGWTIRFWFVLFDIELETECGYDYVEIEEGFETLGKYCGERLPSDIVTNGDELTIHFVSDDTIHRKGFHAKYQLDDEIVYDLPNE